MAAPRLALLDQPFGAQPLGKTLTEELSRPGWSEFRAVVAFLKLSGLRHIAPSLHAFLGRSGVDVRISVGIDHDGTSLEGLQDLWRVMNGRGQLYVYKEGQGGQARTFHPKTCLLEGPNRALVVIGSGNWTQGGLFSNHELGTAVRLDLRDTESRAFYASVRAALDRWQRPGPACHEVDATLLQTLYDSEELVPESLIAAGNRAARARSRSGSKARTAGRPTVFGGSGATATAPAPGAQPPMAPAVVVPRPAATIPPAPVVTPVPAVTTHQALLIEVRPHPNGEVFLSKTAVDDDPVFFGYPFPGWTTPKKATNPPYPMMTPDPQVQIVVHDKTGTPVLKLLHSLNVVYYTPKSEIRITIPPEAIARIPELSLLVMTKNPSASLDYQLDFFPPNCTTTHVTALRSKLIVSLPSGGSSVPRRYGWM